MKPLQPGTFRDSVRVFLNVIRVETRLAFFVLIDCLMLAEKYPVWKILAINGLIVPLMGIFVVLGEMSTNRLRQAAEAIKEPILPSDVQAEIKRQAEIRKRKKGDSEESPRLPLD